jgi:hypothetical protein
MSRAQKILAAADQYRDARDQYALTRSAQSADEVIEVTT